jgi:16S rRNA G527 N7-methylase RsmG
VTVLGARAEDLARDPSFRARFDRVVSRASGTAMEVWGRTGEIRCAGARLLAIKGTDAEEERAEAERAGLSARLVPIPAGGGRLALLVVGDA